MKPRPVLCSGTLFLIGLVFFNAAGITYAGLISIGTNFKGTDRSAEVGLGSARFPPDTMGAVGPSHITEIINGAFAVYNKTGVIQSRVSLDNFWNRAFANAGTAASANDSFDPRILYDKHSGRWYAVSVDTRQSANSRVLVGVTTASDPSLANWRGFTIDADAAGTRWADFPTIGLDASGLYVSTNMLDVPGGGTESTTVTFIGVPKSSLTAAIPSLNGFVKQENLNPSSTGFSVQPAVDLDNSSLPLKALSSFNKPGGVLKTSQIPADFFATGTLTTTGGFLTVTGRSAPPDATQPSGVSLIDTGDNRFSGNVVEQNGSLWGVHSVSINARAALEWYEIDVVTNRLLQSGTIIDPIVDIYYPSISVNDFEDVLIGFSGSNGSTSVSPYVTIGETIAGITTFTPVVQIFAGNGTYVRLDAGGRNRWGDYSATVVDPIDERAFWTFQEYVDGNQNWAIRITEINVRAVPEPSSVGLAVVGMGSLFIFFRRRQLRKRFGRIDHADIEAMN